MTIKQLKSKKSRLGRLSLWDTTKAGIMFVITSILSAVIDILNTYMSLNTYKMPSQEDWKKIIIIAVISTCSYIIKQLITNNNDEILTADKPV